MKHGQNRCGYLGGRAEWGPPGRREAPIQRPEGALTRTPARFPVDVTATGGARELDRYSGAPSGFVFLRFLVRLSIWHNSILADKARLRHYFLR